MKTGSSAGAKWGYLSLENVLAAEVALFWGEARAGWGDDPHTMSRASHLALVDSIT